eukprot:5683333-Prymnesium_polylepis.1
MERRVASEVRRVDARASIDEGVHHLGVAAERRAVQRGVAVLVRHVRVCPHPQKLHHHAQRRRRVLGLGCHVQRRHSVLGRT